MKNEFFRQKPHFTDMVTTCILVLFRLQNAVSFTHHKIFL